MGWYTLDVLGHLCIVLVVILGGVSPALEVDLHLVGLYLAAVLTCGFVTSLAARNYGNRFALNVLAKESAT
jgi:hypothetical protein